ncbi:tRNA 2-thiouridine(34) synthase MnmA [Arcanobacterium ihumii]|uniref:tRNA 2-thiouridine(34) synthase MnmA n=1 Tax=Arcanobacterium ihumii TaxID=2138162 RepID=UPI000F545A9E|nr:tRNA 2-thiouridine(34) synthase MnmA [Arcanobacterium ihumii]
MKILAAMSGGVDSSVATARMVEQGHDVTGVYLALHANMKSDVVPDGPLTGCGNPRDRQDAARVAELLGIDFQVWDYAEVFSKLVIDYFLDAYQRGYTPNPCVHCNEHVKFAVLHKFAAEHGFDAVISGHYARTLHRSNSGTGFTQLRRARYRGKDQSYVLSAVGLETLERSYFPLGDAESKDVIRAEAERRGLGVSSKPDSYDICFIPDGDTRGFIEARLGKQAGEIQDENGKVVGEHAGVYGYTIGQRKGLGLDRSIQGKEPKFVIDVDAKSNIVTVGPKELLSVCSIRAVDANWLAPDINTGDALEAFVQVRAHGRELPASITLADGVMDIELQEQVRGLPRGQSVVVYREDRVLGRAIVETTRR